MSYLLSSEDRQKLQAHQPIHNGGVLLLLRGLIIVFACVWGGGVIRSLWAGLAHTAADSAVYSYQLGIVFSLELALVIVFMTITRAWSWLKAYWLRNVVGYVAQFTLVTDESGEGAQGTRLNCLIQRRRHDLDDRLEKIRHASLVLPEHPVLISLPLGGWFTSSAVISDDVRVTAGLNNWKFRLLAIFDTNVVMVRMEKMNRLHDVRERVITSVDRALQMLELVLIPQNSITSISDLLGRYKLYAELDSAKLKKVIADCDFWQNRYIDNLINTIDAIDATKRFVRSRQAMDIREGLIIELLTWLADDDPRRAKYVAAALVV